ncbi:hypothetical protein AKO1_015403 [Acrasis kona]|uniref:COMM domain-containing protein n=1 Tax=Acrasis kona TaxID=1008807 RepID=A0AAW2YRQ9_9EUKA
MFLKLGDEHRDDLDSIANLSPSALTQCCELAISLIADGANPRAVTAVAQELELERTDVDTIVKALSFLFSECARANLPESEFTLTILDLNVSSEAQEVFMEQYRQHVKKLRELFVRADAKTDHLFGISAIPQYKDLEWRMEIELDRRNVRQLVRPHFTLNLKTSEQVEFGTRDETNKLNNVYMTAEYHDLRHATDVLGEALKEIKTQHVRRIRNYIQ